MKLHLPLLLRSALLTLCAVAPCALAATLEEKSDFRPQLSGDYTLSGALEYSATDAWWEDEPAQIFCRTATATIEGGSAGTDALVLNGEGQDLVSLQVTGDLSIRRLAELSFNNSGILIVNAAGSLTLSDIDRFAVNGQETVIADGKTGNAYGAVQLSGEGEWTDNGDISFSENSLCGTNANLYGAAVTDSEALTISGQNKVQFTNNALTETDTTLDSKAAGAAIYVGKGAALTLSDNETLSFTGNTATARSYVTGGAIGGDAGASDIAVTDNGAVVFSGNSITATRTGSTNACYAYGSAIYGRNITLSGNVSLSFTGNAVLAAGNAMGAVYATGNLILRGAAEFGGNYEKTSAGYRLRGLVNVSSVAASQSVLEISATTGNSILFRDSVYLDTKAKELALNKTYEDSDDEWVETDGSVIFSGETTAADLLTIKGKAGTATELANSRASVINTDAVLYGGRLEIVEQADVTASSLTAAAFSDSATLLRNGTLRCTTATFYDSTALEISGVNTLEAEYLMLKDGSTLHTTLSSANLTQSALTVSGILQTGEITLDFAAVDLYTTGDYRVMTVSGGYDNWRKTWTEDKVTVKGLQRAFASCSWSGDTLVLYVYVPTFSSVNWTNDSGDGCWNTSSINWANGEFLYANTKTFAVVFGDEGAGTVHFGCKQTPTSVTVNSTDDYTFDGSGYLSGSGSLVKKGSGTLTIKTANLHTGATKLSEGTLIVGNASALGRGSVTQTGGVLDLGGYALTNSISLSAGALRGASHYAGKLTTSGTAELVGNVSCTSLTLSGGVLALTPGSVDTGTLTISKATTLSLGELEEGRTYCVLMADTLKGSLNNLSVTGYTSDEYVWSYYGDTLYLIRDIPDQEEFWTGTKVTWNGQRGILNSDSMVLNIEKCDSRPLLWAYGKNKSPLSMTGTGSVKGSTIVAIGGSFNTKTGTGSKGKGVFNINVDGGLSGTSLSSTYGATVNLYSSFSGGELAVETAGTLNIEGSVSHADLRFAGGTMTAAALTSSTLLFDVTSSTTANLFIGNLTLSDGATVTVNYTGKNTKPLLAVQGVLTLGGEVAITVDTSEATKTIKPHDMVLFQTLGTKGTVNQISIDMPDGWNGTLKRLVVNANDLIVWLQNPSKPAYTKPKALSGTMVSFLPQETGNVFYDTNLELTESTERSLTWGSTKGKGAFALSGAGTLSGETLTVCGGWNATKAVAKAGKAEYTADATLDFDTIAAVQGATLHLEQAVSDTTLSVAAGSTKTTLLDVLGGGSGLTLDYAGGTIRGNLTAAAVTMTFDKTVKQQNIFDGYLTLSGDVTVTATTKITRPLLAVTGTLTLSEGCTVNITGDPKQGDFIIFQSRGQSTKATVLFNGSALETALLTSGEFTLQAYYTKKAPKAIKLAACSTEPPMNGACATTLVLGEEGGSLTDFYELESGDFSAVEVRSGIAQIAEGDTIEADVVVGLGAGAFNATLINAGTLVGRVNIAADASVDNQGLLRGNVFNEGTLHNDGRIEGSVTVASGATLRGSGSISALTLADGAILSSTGDTMTVGSLTLGGETVVSLYLEGVSGAVSRELLKADSVSGEGTWSLTLSGASMEDAELVWEDGVLTLKGTAAEQQALVAAPATAPDTRVPQLLANSLWAVTETTKSFVNNALRQYRDRAAGKTTAYASALGSFVNMSGFTANGGGGAVGVEHNVAEGAALGLSLGYTDSKLKGDGAAIDQDSTHAAVYTDIRRGAWGLQAYAAYGDTENKLRGSRAEFDTDDYAAGATTSWSIGCVSLFSGLRYAAARADVADGRMQVWQLPVGATVSKQYGKLITSATAAYVGDLARQNPRVKAAGESIRGANPGRSGFELNLGATYLFSDSWSASANYALETRSRATSQSINASVRYSF